MFKRKKEKVEVGLAFIIVLFIFGLTQSAHALCRDDTPKTTNLPSFYYGTAMIQGIDVQAGDEIRAYVDDVTVNGGCVGFYEVDDLGEYGAMPVYGDDVTTSEKDGVVNGDIIHFFVCHNGFEYEFDQTSVWNSSYVQNVIKLNLNINPIQPRIYSITPNVGNSVLSTNVTIEGSGFYYKPKVAIYGGGPYIKGSCNTPGESLDIYVSGAYAYVADGGSGILMIDISNPVIPSIVGSCDTPGYASSIQVSATYAYVADRGSGIQVIDISNPATLSIVGSCVTPRNALDIYVSGTFAYVASAQSGIQVIDISNPATPFIVGSCDMPDSAHGIQVSGTYAYVADWDSGIQVIDISNPANPFIVGSCDTPGYCYGIQVSGTYAYVADGGSGIQVIDISNPANPFIVGSCDTPGNAYYVHVSGTYAYVADGDSGIQVMDISNPATPSIVSSCDILGSGWTHGIQVSGTYAYVAYGGAGLKVIDIGNPATPSVVGSCDTPGNAYGIQVSGIYAYVADRNSGIHAIDISNPATPSIVGSCDTPGSACGIKVSGTYAYVADWDSGIQVIDISNPATSYIVGSCDTPGHARDIDVSGTYAYVADDSSGMHTIDISDPATPSIVGSCYMPSYTCDIQVLGTYAYVANWKGIKVIDISNPATPSIVGSYDTLSYFSDIQVLGTYAYVTAWYSGIKVIDISNPATPSIVGSCYTPGGSIDIYVSDTYAYVADFSSGIQVIDISNPAAPFIVGSCQTPGASQAIYVSGTYIYVTDKSGLYIIDTFKSVNSIEYINSKTIKAIIPEGFRPGTYNLHVTNPYGGHAILHNAFSVYQTYYRDEDEDGYGDIKNYVQALSAPIGYVSGNIDCDDSDPSKFPGNPEICDGKDNDCNGQIDEGYTIFYKDEDNDGQGIIGDSCCLYSPDVHSKYITKYAGDPDDLDPNIQGTILTGNINLPSGWSMVSLPLIPNNASVSLLFPGVAVVYGYEKNDGYVRVEEDQKLEVGKGYWFLLNEPKIYTLIGEIIDEYKKSVQNGWYMIGGCSSDAKASGDNCNIGVIYGYEQGSGYKRIQGSESLKLGKGYWILFEDIFDQAILTVQGMK